MPDEKLLLERSLDWIQWGRRHYYMGPLGLHNKININMHISHLLPKIPKLLRANIIKYRSNFLHDKIKRKLHLGNLQPLDYAETTALDDFHKKVLKNINKPDIVYTLANGYDIMPKIDANLKIHDQVACHLTLAEIANEHNSQKIDLDTLYDRELKLYKSVDLVLCPSENVRDYVKKISPSSNTKIVKFPIKGAGLRHSYGITSNKLRALFVGRVEPEKGFRTILELAKRCTDVEFHCVGAVLMNVEDAPTNIKFYGAVAHSKISEFYKKADVFLFPSLSEGSATVTQEAMAHGLPGIVSYQSGSHYVNDYSGYVIDAFDTEEFHNALLKIKENRHLIQDLETGIQDHVNYYTVDRYQNELYESIFNLTNLKK